MKNKNWFEVSVKGLRELGHEKGNHTESSYHEALTKMAGELIMDALEEPKFFK